METFLHESGWDVPSTAGMIRVVSRLVTAMLFGAMVGWERERRGRAAGFRTHMMVSLGAALFTLVPLEFGATSLTEVVKGIAPGVGFLGAGAILKLSAEREIKGLTTAAGIWLTAAIGLAVGAGKMWLALVSLILAILVLTLFSWFERHIGDTQPRSDARHEP